MFTRLKPSPPPGGKPLSPPGGKPPGVKRMTDPVYISLNGRWQTIVLDDNLIEVYDLTANPALQETFDATIGELRFVNRPPYVPVGGGQYLNYQSVVRRAVHNVRSREMGPRRWRRGVLLP